MCVFFFFSPRTLTSFILHGTFNLAFEKITREKKEGKKCIIALLECSNGDETREK